MVPVLLDQRLRLLAGDTVLLGQIVDLVGLIFGHSTAILLTALCNLSSAINQPRVYPRPPMSPPRGPQSERSMSLSL